MQNSIRFHGIKWEWLRHGLYLGEMHSSRNIYGIINWAWYAAEESQYAMSANQIQPEIWLRLANDLISEETTTETSFLVFMFDVPDIFFRNASDILSLVSSKDFQLPEHFVFVGKFQAKICWPPKPACFIQVHSTYKSGQNLCRFLCQMPQPSQLTRILHHAWWQWLYHRPGWEKK